MESSRDRVLTDDELRMVWNAADQLGPPFGLVVKLLILTGQRRGEVVNMEWSEISLDRRLWCLPRERVKNDRAHDVPLTPQAIDVLRQVPRISGRFIFSINGEIPINGFGKNKDRLDALLPSDIAAWTIHDIRRTVASGMAKLGISLPVIEKILNHAAVHFQESWPCISATISRRKNARHSRLGLITLPLLSRTNPPRWLACGGRNEPDIDIFLAYSPKELYDQGDKTQILVGLHWCFIFHEPIPPWLEQAFQNAYGAKPEYKIKSWDEVFGRPLKKGIRPERERRNKDCE